MNNDEKIQKIVKESGAKHIAIIMDGNRRWAKKNFLPAAAGHTKGVDALRSTISACIDFGIKYLTVYAFSTENMKRSEEEVAFLMSLLAKTIKAELPEFHKNDVRVRFLGQKLSGRPDLNEVIENCEKETEAHKTLNLQIAFNYGARAEIAEAVRNISGKIKRGEILPQDINEELIEQNLYTAGMPCPDLLIRTGGEMRISNFLLWQCAYSEFIVTEKFWPEFDKSALALALEEFASRNRRFGK